MAHFDASDDDWPTSAFDEPTVVLDKSGMRVPAYALEGMIADQPGSPFEDPTVAFDKSGMRIPAYALEGLGVERAVFESDDPAIDRLVAQLVSLKRVIQSQKSIGLGSALRVQAERLRQMVQERIDLGQIAGLRAQQLQAIAVENIKAIREKTPPAQAAAVAKATEAAKKTSAKKLVTYGVPIAAAIWLLSVIAGGE